MVTSKWGLPLIQTDLVSLKKKRDTRRKCHMKTQRHRRDDVMTEAEIGELELQTQEVQGPVATPGVRKNQGRILHCGFQKEDGPPNTLVPDFTSRTIRNIFLLF